MNARGTLPCRQALYVANADSRDITVLAADPGGGALNEVERFAAGGMVMPLAVHPSGRVLYASIRSEPWSVLSLAIDAERDGRLRELARTPLPASMCWISTDAGGRFLLAAAYHESRVSVSPIDVDGIVGPAQQVIETPANAHCIRTDPSNRFAFAACLGGGVIRQWRFDRATGRLDDNDPPAWTARPGAGPRHLAFHPRLHVVYLVNELDASIDVLSLDTDRGTLRTVQTVRLLPPDFAGGEPWAAEIQVTPDGRFVYASERRTSTLAAFAADASSGALTSIGSVPTETQPRGFAVSLDGRFLYAVGQVSNRLSRYAIDPSRGALTKLGDQPVGKNPNWIATVDLAR